VTFLKLLKFSIRMLFIFIFKTQVRTRER